MKKIIMRVMAFALALITLTAGTRLDVSAFNAGEGSICEAFEDGYYIGSDGLYYGYPMTGPNASHFEYVVFDENGVGEYWCVEYTVSTKDNINILLQLLHQWCQNSLRTQWDRSYK